jgi:hypothetical protein
MEKVVVDGTNVAFEQKSEDGRAMLDNILQLRSLLLECGFEPIIIVEADLRYEIDNREGLEELLNRGEILQAPADTEADFFVLKTAELENLKFVSNDLYNKYRDQFPWIRERRVPFMLVKGHLELYPNLEGDRPEEIHHATGQSS